MNGKPPRLDLIQFPVLRNRTNKGVIGKGKHCCFTAMFMQMVG